MNFSKELNNNLQRYNINNNIITLQNYSNQIKLLLEQIIVTDDSRMLDYNLNLCKNLIDVTLKISSLELLNTYKRFGNFFGFLFTYIVEYLKIKTLKA
jgi:hypothetical protein